MRLAYVTLPLGTLLAASGIWMIVAASRASGPSSSPSTGLEPVHPVTAEMARETAAWSAKKAPDFNLADASGKGWTLASLTAGKPLFLYFIIDGCPCSEAAEPHFQRLYKLYKGRVNFAAVIGSGPKAAVAWVKTHSTPYPVLADSKLAAVHAFNAKHSVYNLLVFPDGTIDTMWPGYSQDLLRDINRHLSAAISVPEQPFDTLDAPLKLTSGCFFPSRS